MLRLIEKADVFVSNYREAALGRLGLTYERLSALNPRLIYANLTGFGAAGPEKDKPGFDTTCFWAKNGMLLDIAQEGSVVNPPYAVGDFAAGQALAFGIMAALFHRERTGRGNRVATSLLAEAVFLNFDAIIESQYGEQYPKRRTAPMRALLNTYQSGDGQWFTINALHYWKISWPAICRFIGREDLLEQYHCIEDTMYENAPAVVAALDEGFKKHTLDEICAALGQCGKISVERAQHSIEVSSDPQVLQNGMMANWTDRDGRQVKMPATPVRIGDDAAAPFRAGPALGEHTREVLSRFGYTEEQSSSLIERGIVAAQQ